MEERKGHVGRIKRRDGGKAKTSRRKRNKLTESPLSRTKSSLLCAWLGTCSRASPLPPAVRPLAVPFLISTFPGKKKKKRS